VKLKIRWPDFTTPTRQLTLSQPTDDGEEIAEDLSINSTAPTEI
jgi:hypothetical protein